jgi:UDP-4-amino-4,6-dideoxy-N-acetyl-beta-L-altrosamine N-acetyltransferase
MLHEDIIIGKICLTNFTRLSNKELKLVLQWRNHKNVRYFLASNPKKISFTEHNNFVRSLKKRKDRFYFLVKHDNQYLGVVILLDIDYYNKHCQWGYYTSPDSAHRGIGIILEYLALYLAFDVLDLHCLRCETIEHHKSARRLHDFFGFDVEGTLRDYAYRDEEQRYFNAVVMSITKDTWLMQKPILEQTIIRLFET